MLLFFAVLPVLVWNGDPSTASTLRQEHITHIAVQNPEAWKASGVPATTLPAQAAKLTPPGARYRADVAGATTAPWVEAHGWQIARNPKQPFLYDQVPGNQLALAAAEAFANGGEEVYIQPAFPDDAPIFGRVLEFLRKFESGPQPPVANIDVVEDGTAELGEVLNLFARRNLLFRVDPKPVPGYDLTVQLGSKKYPRERAANPSSFAQQVRSELTDDRRLLRIYGSEVVLGRLTGSGVHMRLHLLNYGGRPIDGLRIRIKGDFRVVNAAGFDQPDLDLQDLVQNREAVEFTVPKLATYAIVDLEHSAR